MNDGTGSKYVRGKHSRRNGNQVTSPFFSLCSSSICSIYQFFEQVFVLFHFAHANDVNRHIVLFQLSSGLGERLGFGKDGTSDKQDNALRAILVATMLEGERGDLDRGSDVDLVGGHSQIVQSVEDFADIVRRTDEKLGACRNPDGRFWM